MSTSNQSVGRYDPCPCGSGEKYKFCCEKADRERQKQVTPLWPLAALPDRYDGGIERVTTDDGDELMLYGYEITGEPVEEGGSALPPEVRERAADYFDQARSHPRKAIARLGPLVERYPEVPALKNWLMVAYDGAGRKADADALRERIWREHPDYLFGRISRAYDHMERGELEQVPEVLGGRDLKLIYPQRNVFHISEALSLWALLAEWYFLCGEDEAALDHLDRMLEIDPDHQLTKYTELLLMPLILSDAMEHLLERRPRRTKQVKSKVKSRAKSKTVRPGRPDRAESEKRNSPDDVVVDPAPLRVPRNAC